MIVANVYYPNLMRNAKQYIEIYLNMNELRLMFALNRGRGFFLCMSKFQEV